MNLSCVFLGLMVTGTAADMDDATKKEWQKLEGSWVSVSIEVGGSKAPPEKPPRVCTFKDGKMLVKSGGNPATESLLKFDPTKTPKTMDMIPGKGAPTQEVLRGVYKITDDKLEICYSEDARPKEVSSKEGILWTLKRQKKEKE